MARGPGDGGCEMNQTADSVMRMKLIWLSVVPVLLASCTMIPKYQRPAAPVAAHWPQSPAYARMSQAPEGVQALPAADIGWGQFFNDPRLRALIGLALENNRDLRVAALNVEAVRAQYRIQRSALLPDVGVNGSVVRQRLPTGAVASGGSGGSGLTFTRYNVSLGVTGYELDLFGRIRSLKEQALENYLATDEARLGVQISLVAEVANQYLAEREVDELLDLTRKTLAAVTNSYTLIKGSFDLGNASEIDVHAAEAQVQTARANVAVYTRQRAQAENALVLLVGESWPADLPAPQPLEAQDLLANLPAGLPSDLLTRRPDILAAEHQLKAANANIGAARAAFFPRILLTGSGGFSSTDLATLFEPMSQTWTFAPQIRIPIFEETYNKANLDLAHARKRIEIARYEQAIQTAFREVADALAGRASFEDQIAAEEALVAAEQKRYDLAEVRYRNGVDNYLAVLTAQQDLYGAQQRLIQSRFLELANQVTLYKALGGGWREKG